MNARTILSAKGQVVIPKDVRDALGLKPGQMLNVIRSGDGVFLRPDCEIPGKSIVEVAARLREIASAYKGPPLSVEQLGWAPGLDDRE